MAALHVLFTMDVPTPGSRAAPYAAAGWEASARAIDAFCVPLLNAGFSATLFLTPEAAALHAPMCEDLAASGVEIGLLVEPRTLRGAGLKHLLGAYSRDEQVSIVQRARSEFTDALSIRPQSVRSAFYSANDHTFEVLSGAGFRQASVSSPGRYAPKHHAVWERAASDPHFASTTTRLSPGTLPLLEVPVTTDATQRQGGIAPDLTIERGTVEQWHAPLIDGQLTRHEAERVLFRTLCFVTSSGAGYHDVNATVRRTLAMLVEHLDEIGERMPIVPTTLAGAYPLYRQLTTAPNGRPS